MVLSQTSQKNKSGEIFKVLYSLGPDKGKLHQAMAEARRHTTGGVLEISRVDTSNTCNLHTVDFSNCRLVDWRLNTADTFNPGALLNTEIVFTDGFKVRHPGLYEKSKACFDYPYI